MHNPNMQQIRERFGLSQMEFAQRFGFSLRQVRSVERGQEMPCGADRTLLLLLERIPAEVQKALADADLPLAKPNETEYR